MPPNTRYIQHNTTQHNTKQHNTTQHNQSIGLSPTPCFLTHVTYNTTQHNTTQNNTTQHKTTQHNTTQHNTTQHNTTQSVYRPLSNTMPHNTRYLTLLLNSALCLPVSCEMLTHTYYSCVLVYRRVPCTNVTL